MWYDPEEVEVEKYEEIDGRSNLLTSLERGREFHKAKAGAKPSAVFVTDDEVHPEAGEREIEAYDDPAFKSLTPLETLKMIVQRYPGAHQFKRDEHDRWALRSTTRWAV